MLSNKPRIHIKTSEGEVIVFARVDDLTDTISDPDTGIVFTDTRLDVDGKQTITGIKEVPTPEITT